MQASTYYAQASDPSRASLSLLLPLTGTNGSTTFTDLSPTPKTITVHNSAQVSTADGMAAGSCLDLTAATTDWLETANHADFNFGSGDFTIEMGIKIKTMPGAGGVWGVFYKRATGAVFGPFGIFINPDGSWVCLSSTSGGAWEILITAPVGNLAVYPVFGHLIYCRSGNTFFSGFNGAVVASGVAAGALMVNTSTVAVGVASSAPTFPADIRLNHLRVTKGVCRYSVAGGLGSSYNGISSPTFQRGSNVATPAIPWPTT